MKRPFRHWTSSGLEMLRNALQDAVPARTNAPAASQRTWGIRRALDVMRAHGARESAIAAGLESRLELARDVRRFDEEVARRFAEGLSADMTARMMNADIERVRASLHWQRLEGPWEVRR